MIQLSIIIVTYNSLQYIFNCIESIYEFNDLDESKFEIIIVDNSSIENFTEMSRLLFDKYKNRIQLIRNEENKGFGQGNNVGIKIAKGKYVCLSNPDILFRVPVFQKVLKLFQDNKDLAMIGGKQIGGRNSSFLNRPEYDFFVFTAILSDFLNIVNLYFQNYFYLSGALLFIDKEKFIEIGLFDENIFLYFEESDITKRFLKNGYSTKFVKGFIYDHLVGGREITSETVFDIEIDSVKKYCLKYHYNFRSFVNRKIISYRIMICFCKLLGKNDRVRKSEIYLNKFLKVKSDLVLNEIKM